MRQSKNKKREVTAALYVRLSRDDNLEGDSYSIGNQKKLLTKIAKEKGYKNGYVLWPIRTALSGKQMTPCGATEIMEVIGKEESIARIEKAIDKLSESL